MTGSPPAPRRILYVASMGSESTAGYRCNALQRLGQQVEVFDVLAHVPKNHYVRTVQSRFPMGLLVSSINRSLLQAAKQFRPDVVWMDKPILFTPATHKTLKRNGAKIVYYVQDNPFGNRNDGIWRQFLASYRLADLHCLVRDADVARYQAWNLPHLKTLFSFAPEVHFPPPAPWTDADRTRQISYIGHPYEERPAFLTRLATEFDLPLFINGNIWPQLFQPQVPANITLGGHMPGAKYREGIWRSRINLGFVTRQNEDDIGHKSVEIAACGAFLFAVRTPGHEAIFEEDKEAIFFSSVEECAEKARFYLGRPDLREAIAAAGRERAVKSGYNNDTQLAMALNKLDGKE
ncbi:CgeB family protein [Silvibacterium acidisoli]|uniref:CgeB family protein n=1 Tax=Acidobacteriaceae bacterium ZG23-2 TaxID=2883246 RepID=UPI00406CDD07